MEIAHRWPGAHRRIIYYAWYHTYPFHITMCTLCSSLPQIPRRGATRDTEDPFDAIAIQHRAWPSPEECAFGHHWAVCELGATTQRKYSISSKWYLCHGTCGAAIQDSNAASVTRHAGASCVRLVVEEHSEQSAFSFSTRDLGMRLRTSASGLDWLRAGCFQTVSPIW